MSNSKLVKVEADLKGKFKIEDDGYNVQIQTRNGECLFAFCYGEYLY